MAGGKNEQKGKQKGASKKPVRNVPEEVDEAYSLTPLMKMTTIYEADEWEWKRNTATQQTRVLMNTHCSPDIVDEIKSVLGKTGRNLVEEFARSCFGHFLQFHHVNYTGNSCIHQLLTREVIVKGADQYERLFRVGQRMIRFSKYEFALVMGLKFGNMEYNPHLTYKELPNTNLFKRHYGVSRKSLKADELRTSFVEGKFKEGSDDTVKVGTLLFYLYMLSGQESKKTIPAWLWDLVEHPKRWEEFAWGTFVYNRLLEGIDQVDTWNSSASFAKLSDSKFRYHFYGCSIALTIWAYEAIPPIGLLFGRRDDSDTLRPRIIRWTFKDGVPKERSVEVIRMLDETKVCQLPCYGWLVPDQHETYESYWQDIHCTTYITRPSGEHSPETSTPRRQSRSPQAWERTSQVGVATSPRGSSEHDRTMFRLPSPLRVQRPHFDFGADRSHGPPQTMFDSVFTSQHNQNFEDTNATREQNERAYESPRYTHEPHTATYPLVQCPCTEHVAELKGEVQQVGLQLKSVQTSLDKLNDRVDTRANEFVEELYYSESQMMFAFQYMHDWMWEFVSDDAFRVLRALSKKSHRNHAKIVDGELGASANVKRPQPYPDQFKWTNTVRPKIGRSTLYPELPKMSPFSAVPKMVVEGLCKFINSSESLMLNEFDHVDAQWFKDLLTLDSELLHTHVDVFLRIMNENPIWYCPYETPFLEDMAFMPMDISIEYMNLFNLCKGSINELSDQQLSSLIENALGNCYSWKTKGRAWKDVKYVCLVASFNKHFYACRAELRTGMFFVYDSLHFKWTEEILVMRQDQTRVYRTLIPLVMAKIKYRETHLDTVNTGEFTFLKGDDRDTYRQEDNESCGIYAMLHVYSWARGQISGLHRHKQNLSMIREEMAIKFYQYILSKQGQTPPQ